MFFFFLNVIYDMARNLLTLLEFTQQVHWKSAFLILSQ